MADVAHARLDSRFTVDLPSAMGDASAGTAKALPDGFHMSVHDDFSTVERDWRELEANGDGTVFQTYDWLTTWHRHIGALTGVRPAIVIGRDTSGVMFMLPLSTRAISFVRELTWLGTDLCDYNAPLLAPDFSGRLGGVSFASVWADIVNCLQANAKHRFDMIDLSKMPAMVGGQPNPMLALGVAASPSGAYSTRFTSDWETFYAAKRSSTTRRRDRTKRKRLAEFGEVRLVNPDSAIEIVSTLETLMTQKARLFAHMGVGNLFAKPGHADFYRALASEPATRKLAHVSRLDVGATPAAVNLGLTWRGCYYHLLASYDDGELSRFGSGAAHLHELLRLAIERGYQVFDFTIGDERYKRDWCDTEIKLYDRISAATWRGALVATPMLAGRRLKRWIKQTAVLWNAFSAARACAGSMLRVIRR